MLSGGISQAFRKCEMFSICMNGIADFLNLTPGLGTARLMSLQYVSHWQYLYSVFTVLAKHGSVFKHVEQIASW
jgi:hypothetical protein